MSETCFGGSTGNPSKGRTRAQFDAEAGPHFLNARYCEPDLAMFTQPDWWEITEPGVGTNGCADAGGDLVKVNSPWICRRLAW